MRRSFPPQGRGGGGWRAVPDSDQGTKGSGGDAFVEREEMDALPIDEIKRRLDACSEPSMFGGKVCNCVSPATLLWLLNLVCFVVHSSMAAVVFREGARVGDIVDFQTTSIKNTFNQSSRANWYTPFLSDDAPVLGLDLLCGTFALLSAMAHLLVCVFSRFAVNESHLRLNLQWYYFGLHSCLIWWRWCEYFFSSAVMVVAMLLVCGVQEINTIVLCAFGQATTILFGWATELYARPDYNVEHGWEIRSLWTRLIPYFAGFLPYFPSWLVFVVTFVKNVESAKELNDVTTPGFVYGIISSEVVLFGLFAIPLPVWQARHPKYYWNTGASAQPNRRTSVCPTVASVNDIPPVPRRARLLHPFARL